MFELEIELDDNYELEEVLPVFENSLSQNRFWVYKTLYQGKISYIIVDMLEKNRYLFLDDSSTLGKIYTLEKGELFDIEYIADFNDWNVFMTKFEEHAKMANLVSIIIEADIERDEDEEYEENEEGEYEVDEEE